jgi:hypothetical protein
MQADAPCSVPPLLPPPPLLSSPHPQVVKGGKLMGFRCVAVVGDGKGRVGVGCQAGREVSTAVKRALVDAKKVSSGSGVLARSVWCV